MNALVIMAKEPKPELTKTRLVPPLNPTEAAQLYYHFLLDKIEQVRTINSAKFFIAYYPPRAQQFFHTLAPEFTLICQRGKTLGEKLSHVSESLLNQGFKKILLLDSDSPNLPIKYIRDGIESLDDVDVVIGPCVDGGYYLIGSRLKISEVFKEIPWSTPLVTKLTVERAERLGLKVTLLNEWYDIDTMEDLLRLTKDLEKKAVSSLKKSSGENTYRFISHMNLKKNY